MNFFSKIIIFLSLSCVLSACDGKGSKKNIPHESDMQIFQFQFFDEKTQSKPLRMDIPFAYLRKPWKSIAKINPDALIIKNGEELQIKTIFPELSPHPQSFGTTGKYKQGLYIFMYGSDPFPQSYELTLKNYQKRYQRKSLDFFGFHQYEIACSETRCTGEDFDYVITGPEFSGEATIGRCYKPEKNSGGRLSFYNDIQGQRCYVCFS